jgi:hypothetical protein
LLSLRNTYALLLVFRERRADIGTIIPNITTSSNYNYAVIIENGGKVVLQGGQITTGGLMAMGILADSRAQVTTSTAIATTGNKAIGVQAGDANDKAPPITLINIQDGATISTKGTQAYGLHAYYYGVINGAVGI